MTSTLTTTTLQTTVDGGQVDEESSYEAILSNLNRSTGSVMYTFGDNIVQCSLFGPNPMSGNMNLLKKNYFSIFLYPLGQIKNLKKDKSLSYYEYCFKRTFGPMVYSALLPRSRTYIILNEIEKGSSFVTTSLNAISLSLMDSGYPLNYFISSSGVILDQNGIFYTEKEYRDKIVKSTRTLEPPTLTFETPDHTIKAIFCISVKNKNLKPVSLLAEGRFSLNDVLDAKNRTNSASFFEFTKRKVNKRFV